METISPSWAKLLVPFALAMAILSVAAAVCGFIAMARVVRVAFGAAQLTATR